MLGGLRFSRSFLTKSMSKEFFKVNEVGPRDGLQNEKTFIPTELKIELINRLGKCGFSSIEAASFVSPKWIPQLKDGEKVMKEINRYPNVAYPVVVLNMYGLHKAMSNNNVTEISVFSSCSEGFSKKNVNMSIENHLNRTEEVVNEALNKGLRVRGYLSMIIGCPYDGKTDPKIVARTAEAMLEMGCHEISLGDTTGVGTAASINKMLDEVLTVSSADRFSAHFHDTYGQALANVLVALEVQQ
ncbi:hypothetical protein L596_030792 [Steinernema carpocapsae]|uniref:hydroxymethylglutaryl-CoA lyase n=1 Tax=Steinernema carpocapsae TaxID=34508 RepID=A0A4U5LNS3_STECR|nr:hypothetical protein L596_030792 [Steinernema carpocapsae]